MSISLIGLSPRYQYLNIFNVDKDNDLDENDHPLFKDVKTAEEAEKVVQDNIEELSGLSSIPLACISHDTLPDKTYIKVKIATVYDKDTGERKAVVDGDTIQLDCDLDNNGKPDGVRFKGVNTTEFGKGGGLKSRISRAEPGAVAAWEAMCELFKQADYEVYVCPERFDSNGRMVSQVFVKNGDHYEDVEAILASKGHAMVYFVQIEDYNEYFCYLSLQAQAQKQKTALWGLDYFKDKNDPTGQKLKLIHLTSFHPNARGIPGNKEPLYNEYCRIVNISMHPINMKDYQIYNKDSGKTINLPDFILPPGRTLKIATGGIETQADPKDELILSLGMKEEFWENEGGSCLVIQTKDGKTAGAIGTGRFKKDCP